jgi:uncharacterized protein (DUF433 family)
MMALLETLVPKPPPLEISQDGLVRVAGTRVSLDVIIDAHKKGCSPAGIARKYPSLDETDVYAVITYYRWHRDEVDAYLAESRRRSEALRQRMEVEFPSDGLRDRLLARRAGRE